MKQEQNNISVDAVTDNQPTAEQSLRDENQDIREYYLRQLRLMCPTMSTDKSDSARLSILKQRTTRLVEMLTLFEHSWTEEVPVLQKACLSYLAVDTVPRKERRRLLKRGQAGRISNSAWLVTADYSLNFCSITTV